MRHQLRKLEGKVKRLKKPEASQTRSPLASAEQRRTPRARPQQKTALASSTSQKSKTARRIKVRCISPGKYPKGQSKQEGRGSIPLSNGPRFVKRVKRRRKGERKPTVQKSHLPHEKRKQKRQNGHLHKKISLHGAKVDRTNKMTICESKHACKTKKRCWVCKSRTHKRKNCLEPDNLVKHMSRRGRKRLECWTCR
ncbi:hypothetical protein TSAR_012618 [Trichomalopsis sarcophagae]|uniref:Uncharacterized protein n=1 Tax=Trichomalopsis sarcophagae TaxID=543379 RepID=A0A232ERI0_9HYME|nr:hypothetical protein TSAR_012618 [Trichomalopsis sarcophagae]